MTALDIAVLEQDIKIAKLLYYSNSLYTKSIPEQILNEILKSNDLDFIKN